MYTLNALLTYLTDFGQNIEKIKVTKLEITDFNSMEGYQWYFNVKILLNNGKNRLIKIHTNSTYMDELLDEMENHPTKEFLTELFDNLL